MEYIAVHDYRTRDNDDSEYDHEAEVCLSMSVRGRPRANLYMTLVKQYSALGSHDTSRTTTPTLSVSERLLQGSASLVYDTSIWTSVCDMSVF